MISRRIFAQPVTRFGVAMVMWMGLCHSAIAMSESALNSLAKSTTVRIVGENTSGSGALIERQGNTFTLLTSAHVFEWDDDYTVITADGQRYRLSGIQKHPEADLAIATFEGASSYPTLEIGDSSTLKEGASIYISGYPAKTSALTESVYNFTKGEVTANALQPFQDGYALVYTNTTLPGMSGGPILNNNGALLGIHGRADAQAKLQNEQLNSSIYVKSGVNLGVPINRVFTLIPKTRLAFAPVSTPIANPGAPSVEAELVRELQMQANFKLRQRDLLGAIATMDKAIQLDSQNSLLYSERGDLHMLNRDYLSALIDFTQVVQIEPTLGEGFYNQAVAHSRLGNPDKAIASFEKAMILFQEQGKKEKAKAAKEQLKRFR